VQRRHRHRTSPGPTATDGQPAGTQAIANTLVAASHRAGIAAVSAFVVGALMYYVALYRTRLVPRWLSAWGIAALPFMAAASIVALFADQPVTNYVVLALPLGLQEIVFGIWLLVKGFSPVRPETTDAQAPPQPNVVLTP